MKLDELECFLEVARQRNMTAAAKLLGLAQSTVSDRIQQLEAQLGAPLFERSARERRLELTAAGRRLRAVASRLASVAEEVRRQARASRSRPAPARIGVNETVAHAWLGAWLASLRLEHPELAFDIKVGTSDELDALMVGGALELAIGTRGFGYRAIQRRQLSALPMVFVGQASRHPKAEYSLRELAAEGFITFQPRSTPEQALQELLRAESLQGCRVDTVSSVAIMLRLVEAGAGIATLPRRLIERARQPQLRILGCPAELAPLPLWLSWRARRVGCPVSEVITSLLSFLESERAFRGPASAQRGVRPQRVRR